MFTKIRFAIVFLASFVFVTAVQTALADTEANKALEGRLFEEVWNQNTIAIIDEIISGLPIIPPPFRPVTPDGGEGS